MRYSKVINISERTAALIFGGLDSNLKQIAKAFSVEVAYLGDALTIIGSEAEVEKAALLVEHLAGLDGEVSAEYVGACLGGDFKSAAEAGQSRVKVAGRVKYVSPKSKTHKFYLDEMRGKDMVFAYGPAGTGKTYLAVAMAVNMYLDKAVSKIVLTRPAVEAGERLGFLPGDIAEKINPYLRPLYDALYAMLDHELAMKLMERGIIEVAPLAFMRGRTLSGAFIILDEAQNTTISQMKMFLTRLGFGSKAVITGDITQMDLPPHVDSGLIHAVKTLSNISEIGFVELTEKDVVRHPLVTKIIRSYEQG